MNWARIAEERRERELEQERRERAERQERAWSLSILACHTAGQPYESTSGRPFRARLEAEPKRDGKYIKGGGTQLLLDLCEQTGKTARPRAERKRATVLAELEQRGARAFEELGELERVRRHELVGRLYYETVDGKLVERFRAPVRPPVVLYYESMGGEILVTYLHGCTQAEREAIARVSLDHARAGAGHTQAQQAAELKRIAGLRDAREVIWPSQRPEQPIRVELE